MGRFSRKQKPRTMRNVIPSSGTSPVMRYYRPQETSKVVKQQNSKKIFKVNADGGTKKIKLVLSLLVRFSGFLAIVAVIIANTMLSGVTVKIGNKNDAYKSVDTYIAGINEIMKVSALSSSKLTLNSSKLEQEIKKRFPEITQATAIIPIAGRKLQVNLEFASPMVRLIQENNQQGVVSDSGVLLFVDSAQKINEIYTEIPSLVMLNIVAKAGDQMLTSEETYLISLLRDEMDGSNDKRPMLQNIEYDVKKREMLARFKSTSFYVKLTPEREARAQIGALVATIQELQAKGTIASEYIDVRVEDRVFIK